MNNMQKPPRLLDKVRERMRFEHKAYATERAYITWIHRFIYFHGKLHPREVAQ